MTSVFEHPWLGGLFDEAQMAAIWSPERTLGHLLQFEAVYSRALGIAGVVDIKAAEAAADIIANFNPDITDLRAGTARDGLPIPRLVKQLKSAVGDDLQKAVHDGATSQDVIDTALSLTLRETTNLIEASLSDLTSALNDLMKRFGDQTIMGRTRMQAALPITVSDRVQTWVLPLAQHEMQLKQKRPRIEILHLGGATGNNAALGKKASEICSYMASELRLGNPQKSGHVMRDGIVEFANILSLISGTIGKMGQDICLMAQQGIDEISLHGGGSSSAMPHKQNPIHSELLVTLARFNATQVSGMHHALVSEQERSGAAWMLEWMIVPQMTIATARSLTAANELVSNVRSLGK